MQWTEGVGTPAAVRPAALPNVARRVPPHALGRCGTREVREDRDGIVAP